MQRLFPWGVAGEGLLLWVCERRQGVGVGGVASSVAASEGIVPTRMYMLVYKKHHKCMNLPTELFLLKVFVFKG